METDYDEWWGKRMKRQPPNSHWGVIIAYAALVAATQILWVTFTPITSVAADHWGVSVEAVGWFAQVFPLIYVILAVPFGIWADKWFNGTLVIGAIVTAVGALVRVIPGYEYALAGQILISVAQPLVLNAINRIVSLHTAPHRRPLAIAIGSSSMFVGILISTVSVPLMMDGQEGLPARPNRPGNHNDIRGRGAYRSPQIEAVI